jgi:hypothetical protein
VHPVLIMTPTTSTLRTIVTCAGLLALPLAGACSSSPPASESTTTHPPASPADHHAEWRRAMAKTRTPKSGCFHAKHPSTTWEEVPCVAAPTVPLVPARGVSSTPRFQVGDGAGDYASTVSGTISYAEGSFPFVSGVTKQAGLAPGYTLSGYSLQMNTNTASKTAACAQGPNGAACTAWQQFVYIGGQLFMQYWLIDYFATAPAAGVTCPAGFNFYDNGYYEGTTVIHQYDCYVSSKSAANVPSFPATELQDVSMAADVFGGADQATLYYLGEVMAITPPEGSVLHADQWWTSAEFNVFGPGYGSAALFNYGSTMAVQTITDSNVPTLAAPSCTSTSYTGEINNLTAVAGSCCAFGGAGTGTGIFFTQSNVPGAGAYPCP